MTCNNTTTDSDTDGVLREALSPESATKLIEFIKKRDPLDEGVVDYGDVEFLHRSTRIGLDHPEPVIRQLALVMRSFEVEFLGAEHEGEGAEQFAQLRAELLAAIADPDAYAAENWQKIEWRIRDRKIELAKTIARSSALAEKYASAEPGSDLDEAYYAGLQIDAAWDNIRWGIEAWSVLKADPRLAVHEIGPTILKYLGRTRVDGRIQPPIQPRADASPE